jgi:hypothetical protein
MYLSRVCDFTPDQSASGQLEVTVGVYDYWTLAAKLQRMCHYIIQMHRFPIHLSCNRAQCFSSGCQHDGSDAGTSCV